jgi:hypothetical protein
MINFIKYMSQISDSYLKIYLVKKNLTMHTFVFYVKMNFWTAVKRGTQTSICGRFSYT